MTTEPTTTRAPSVRSRIDIAARNVRILPPGAPEESYTFPTNADRLTELAALGMRDLLIRSLDRAKTYAAILGSGPLGKSPAKSKELSPWHMAYAHSIVKETEKSATPILLDDAKKLAAKLDANGLKLAKEFPAVRKHHERLYGVKKEGSVLDLVRPAPGDEMKEAAD